MEGHLNAESERSLFRHVNVGQKADRKVVADIEVVQIRIHIGVHQLHDIENDCVPYERVTLILVELANRQQPWIAKGIFRRYALVKLLTVIIAFLMVQPHV